MSMPDARAPEYILTLSCPDQRGIVRAVAATLAEGGGNIIDSQQFGDRQAGAFFMRVHFAAEEGGDGEAWRQALEPIATGFGMSWDLHDLGVRARVLVLVSRAGHCLNDLLYRWRSGALAGDIVAVASNQQTQEPLAASYGLPFHDLPGVETPVEERDDALLELVDRERADLVVLGRYMLLFGARACDELRGRAINIHHSFLPWFRGARPYHQAHQRGVKLIGATAHYVTLELDDGPIIEQDVARVDHSASPAELSRLGQDVESVTLARAVQWHLQHRVLLHGSRTVVFR
jgi:formyltetrahydrofolate deformylase